MDAVKAESTTATDSAAPADRSAPPPTAEDESEPLRKIHLVPFEETVAKLGDRTRIDSVAPELRRKRTSKEIVKAGNLIRHDDIEFAVIKCDPPEGRLTQETDFFTEGNPVVCFEKIKFSVWGPKELTPDELFTDIIAPYLKGEYAPYGTEGTHSVRLFYQNQIFHVGENCVQVEATEPLGLGVVTKATEIFSDWDHTPEFEKVHIMPFQDTLPRAYSFDIFNDYIKLYLTSNGHRKFQTNELFMYHGVQFKIVACEPDTTGRISRNTSIFCEGVLHPSARLYLPPDIINRVVQLPPGLQMLMLNNERTAHELEDMLNPRRGLFEETLAQIERISWPPPNTDISQQTCMICLGDFRIADECCRLPCRHVFHASCCDEWLRRCTDCPICKDNVDRAIRQY